MDMEKKYYQIGTQTPEDWPIVHELLMKDGTLEDNIPSRSVECANEILHSPTRSTYLMTDDEAETLRNNSRILCVDLDYTYHPEAAPKAKYATFKYGRNVKNYRALQDSTTTPGTLTQKPPVGEYDGRSSDEFYRTGYQIRRCAQKDNPWPSTPSSILYQDVDYLYDGRDVDLIVVDDGLFIGHPEFVWDEYSPPNYIRGNVLSRSGLCGVLDLALDAPYYLDPEWFDANPSARLTRRWDGTLVPVESVARSWWAGPSGRSASFPNFGSIIVPVTYTRSAHCGPNRTTPPTNEAKGSHGTSCAGLAYGKNFGWAFNANKWTLAINAGSNRSGFVPDTSSDIQKIFHAYKPLNPKFGTKDPTVSSNSWVLGETNVPNDPGYYSYQNGDVVSTGTNSLQTVAFLKKTQSDIKSFFHESFITSDNPGLIAGRELIDSGVIFCVAANNNGRYLASPTDPNWYNYYTTRTSSDTKYVNRPGSPLQWGYRSGETTLKTFSIGAIDDEYTGDIYVETRFLSTTVRELLETSPEYRSAGSGKERLASSRYNTKATTADYSNKGSGIDFYAPADGVLTSSSDISLSSSSTEIYNNPYQISTTMRYHDERFSGTSAACPVFAGLAACFMQNNRALSPADLKTYLKNNIQNQTNFFLGPTPTSATDDRWWNVPYSTMGTPVKLIYQFAATTITPNPTFTPTYGISSSDRVNERFTITHNTSLRNTLGIYGIQMFSSTISSGTSITLEIRNGYYLVGSANRVDAATGSPARDSDGTTFGNLNELLIRVDPTNNKRVQLSDSAGRDSWDDMEITVLNGTFQKVGTQVYYVYNSSTAPVSSPTISTPPFTGSSGAPGSITGASLSVSGSITAGGDVFGLLSDDRVKTNQNQIDNALGKVEQLNGFTYNFNETGEKLGFDPNQRYSGVSAQDVQNVLPEAVAPAPADNNYLTVKYDKLIPLLIESIKDLKNDLDDLKDSK